jgi:hypothetical protein
MCVKEPDRRISTPAALIREFEKIGYRLKGRQAAADVKFTKQADSAPTIVSMRSLIGKGETASKGREETLSFETQDVEIQDFVNRIKLRKKLKKLAGTVAFALVAVIAILVFAWLFGVILI